MSNIDFYIIIISPTFLSKVFLSIAIKNKSMCSCNSANRAFIKQTHPIQVIRESKVGLAKVVSGEDKMKE